MPLKISIKLLLLLHKISDKPVLPRQRKLPRRINDGAPSHQPSTPSDMYRQKYFEALDVICEEINRRFEQKDLKVVVDLERLLFDSANGITTDIPDPSQPLTEVILTRSVCLSICKCYLMLSSNTLVCL